MAQGDGGSGVALSVVLGGWGVSTTSGAATETLGKTLLVFPFCEKSRHEVWRKRRKHRKLL